MLSWDTLRPAVSTAGTRVLLGLCHPRSDQKFVGPVLPLGQQLGSHPTTAGGQSGRKKEPVTEKELKPATQFTRACWTACAAPQFTHAAPTRSDPTFGKAAAS